MSIFKVWPHKQDGWVAGQTNTTDYIDPYVTHMDQNMLLLNDPEDQPTFFSRPWISTATPDLAFATEDLSRKTSQRVLSYLVGSDHRSVLLAFNLQYRPSNPKTLPRWNYKKANWEAFSRLTNEYSKTVKANHFNPNKTTESSTSPSWEQPLKRFLAVPGRTTGRTGLKSYRGLRMTRPEQDRRWKTTQRLRTT